MIPPPQCSLKQNAQNVPMDTSTILHGLALMASKSCGTMTEDERLKRRHGRESAVTAM